TCPTLSSSSSERRSGTWEPSIVTTLHCDNPITMALCSPDPSRRMMLMTLRVAVVGAGPAGIYAADILTKSDVDVSVDLIERLPAPFGLVRYGVAPDHPRIKEIIKALQRVLAKPEVRFLGNVNFGEDVKLEDLRDFYDAVIVSTG